MFHFAEKWCCLRGGKSTSRNSTVLRQIAMPKKGINLRLIYNKLNNEGYLYKISYNLGKE